MGSKKKLYRSRPKPEPEQIETHRTKKKTRREPSDPTSIERGVRQLLADKVSGNMVGLWLLAAEHLRLGTWDLLRGWTGESTERVEPRLAMQLVHEAALCVTGVRQGRALSQRGFEVLNGLPFVASDQAVHELLSAHTVAEAEAVQVQLGLIRRARGHYHGRLLGIDPHRMRSYSKRQMPRYRGDDTTTPFKTAQTFFSLDLDSGEPLCFTSGSSAISVNRATPPLLAMSAAILGPQHVDALVVADTEHATAKLIDHVHQQTPFDLLVPMAKHKCHLRRWNSIPPQQFTRRWAGYATVKLPYQMTTARTGPQWEFVQRCGETPQDYQFKGFLCTAGDRDEVDDLTLNFPKRWHVEEFFNASQDLGWKRGGTRNRNIRYAQMTMALIAQASISQLRNRLGEPCSQWDAAHLADAVFKGIDGDIRVRDDTIVVTMYNAPNPDKLREQYQGLPGKLQREGVDPRIPWLYNFKLDFRFK